MISEIFVQSASRILWFLNIFIFAFELHDVSNLVYYQDGFQDISLVDSGMVSLFRLTRGQRPVLSEKFT